MTQQRVSGEMLSEYLRTAQSLHAVDPSNGTREKWINVGLDLLDARAELAQMKADLSEDFGGMAWMEVTAQMRRLRAERVRLAEACVMAGENNLDMEDMEIEPAADLAARILAEFDAQTEGK